MGEIRYRQPTPQKGIEYGEIHIPDDQDFGTGTFAMEIQAGAMTPTKGSAYLMVNAPRFQISVNVDTKAKRINAAVGGAAGQDPSDLRIYAFPPKTDLTLANVITVQFGGWKITQLNLNGQVLPAIN